jgi:4-hydroxy-2-oxoheptanedioate aldolase
MKIPVNRFKERLLAGTPQVGLWCSLCSPLAAEVAAHAGFDWLLIDTEHAPNEVADVMANLQAVAEGTASPMVRPVWNDPVVIKRLLDVGVQNLLIPFVETREEAEAAVAATRYPPRGRRGMATMIRANRYGRVPDYLDTVESQMCVVVQLETQRALDNLEEIAAVDGVDALFLGPSDLSANLGFLGQPNHPDAVRAVDDAMRRIRAAGKPAGILTMSEDVAKKRFADGAAFVAVGSDLGIFVKALDALAARFKT